MSAYKQFDPENHPDEECYTCPACGAEMHVDAAGDECPKCGADLTQFDDQ